MFVYLREELHVRVGMVEKDEIYLYPNSAKAGTS
jgi:hypothetical protein